MIAKRWAWSTGLIVLGYLTLGAKSVQAATVGVVLPQGQLAATPDAGEPLRQSLITQLHSRSVEAVPLTAGSGSSADAEAQAKHCDFVLYTRLEKKSGGGGVLGKLGSFGKFASLARMELGGKGANSAAGAAMQQAASSTASAGAQEMTSGQQATATLSAIKQGDTVTVDYRLVAVGTGSAVKSETLSGKAASDGEDVVSPLLAQTAGGVSGATSGATPTPAAAGAASAPSPTSEASQPKEHGSVFGGLFGHHGASSQKSAGAAADSSIDCNKIVAMSGTMTLTGPMSLADCQKMQASQQTYTQAAAQAARPGDEQMTCDQITAELRQQQIAAPDKDKAAAALATAHQEQAGLKHAQEVVAKTQAEDQAAVNAASAADTATELATAGLVRGRALDAAEKGVSEHDAAVNAQLVKENSPTQQKLTGQTADLGLDAAAQLQSNPRLARLTQLANARHCKGGG